MNIHDLMVEYNKFLAIEQKGEKYFIDKSIPDCEKDIHTPRFKQVIAKLNELVMEIEKQGCKMTDAEILEGFPVKGRN